MTQSQPYVAELHHFPDPATDQSVKPPVYTVADLQDDLISNEIEHLYLQHPTGCIEVTLDIVWDLLSNRRCTRLKNTSPLVLTIPREGIGILVRAPHIKPARGCPMRQAHRLRKFLGFRPDYGLSTEARRRKHAA